MESHEVGCWRRIRSDETFHFYTGSDLWIYIFNENGELQKIALGNSEQNEAAYLQWTILAHTWFALEVSQPNSYSLVACSVTPGFDYEDYEILDKAMMLKKIPHQEELIHRLGRV